MSCRVPSRRALCCGKTNVSAAAKLAHPPSRSFLLGFVPVVTCALAFRAQERTSKHRRRRLPVSARPARHTAVRTGGAPAVNECPVRSDGGTICASTRAGAPPGTLQTASGLVVRLSVALGPLIGSTSFDNLRPKLGRPFPNLISGSVFHNVDRRWRDSIPIWLFPLLAHVTAIVCSTDRSFSFCSFTRRSIFPVNGGDDYSQAECMPNSGFWGSRDIL